MTEDTTLLRADTGAPVTFRELLDNGHEGVLVWSLDERRRLVPAPVDQRVPLRREARLPTPARLRPGGQGHRQPPVPHLRRLDGAGRPRRRRSNRGPTPHARTDRRRLGWTDSRLGLLAHLLGDGCVLRSQPVHYTSNDKANLEFVETAAAAEFGITPRRVAQKRLVAHIPAGSRTGARTGGTTRCMSGSGAGHRGLGARTRSAFPSAALGQQCRDRRVPPAPVGDRRQRHSAAARQRHRARGLLRDDQPSAGGRRHPTCCPGSGSSLARRRSAKAGCRPGYHVTVADGPEPARVLPAIGVHGRRGETARRLPRRDRGQGREHRTSTLSRSEAWELVKAERSRAGLTERQFQAAIGMHYCGADPRQGVPAASGCCAAPTPSTPTLCARSPRTTCCWDRIVAVEPRRHPAGL